MGGEPGGAEMMSGKYLVVIETVGPQKPSPEKLVRDLIERINSISPTAWQDYYGYVVSSVRVEYGGGHD